MPRDDAERRHLTVMFCDLVGSTALSAHLDPEDLRAVIAAISLHQRGHRPLQGVIARYMGDGVLAYFGYPEAHEDDAEQAARAGLALVEAVANLQTDVDVRCRFASASPRERSSSATSDRRRRSQEQAVVGETPNLAARLQTLAEPGTVFICPSTRQLAEGNSNIANSVRSRSRAGRNRYRPGKCYGPAAWKAASRRSTRPSCRRCSAAKRRSSCCHAGGGMPRRGKVAWWC